MKRAETARAVWSWSVFNLGIVILLAAAAFDGMRQTAGADPTPAASEPPPEQEEVAIDPGEQHVPGTLYDEGAAAIPFEELSPADQEGVLLAAERTEHPAEVTAAYNEYTRKAAADAKVKRAGYAAGMTALEDVGVEP